MNLPPEKFVQKEKCIDCGHNIDSHRLTNVRIGETAYECKALDAAGDQCSCYLNESLIPRGKHAD